jgi:hypothetical protein
MRVVEVPVDITTQLHLEELLVALVALAVAVLAVLLETKAEMQLLILVAAVAVLEQTKLLQLH